MELVLIQTLSDQIPVLAKGDLELAQGGWAASVSNAALRGLPVKVIGDGASLYPGFSPMAITVRKDLIDDGKIRSAADVKGKKVAVTSPQTMSRYFAPVLADAKLTTKDIEFVFNLETITAYKNIDLMFKLPDIFRLSGITVGRVDLVGSMGLSRDDINVSDDVFNICRETLVKAKRIGLKTGMGGGISTKAISPIIRLGEEGLLDKFETRKVVFPISSWKYGEKAIPKAAGFELLWLKSKRRYYSRIKAEDENRIAMLEVRL